MAATEGPSNYIIREIYEANSPENFENELENALNLEYLTIIIEPAQLADVTARWISVGNGLHKTAVLAGLGSLISLGMTAQHGRFVTSSFIPYSLSFTSALCTAAYMVSWQFDPCCKYQTLLDQRQLETVVPFHSLTSDAPLVLVRKDDTRRKILQCAVTGLALAACAYRIYKSWS